MRQLHPSHSSVSKTRNLLALFFFMRSGSELDSIPDPDSDDSTSRDDETMETQDQEMFDPPISSPIPEETDRGEPSLMMDTECVNIRVFFHRISWLLLSFTSYDVTNLTILDIMQTSPVWQLR